MSKTLLASLLVIGGVAASTINTPDILKRAESGDLKALNQAFLLHTKTDAGDAEDINIAIGKSIPRNPRNFLIALKNNRSKVPRLDSTVGNLGEEFVDDSKRQRLELEKRLTALQTVKDESLKAVRAECVSELKRQIEQIPSE